MEVYMKLSQDEVESTIPYGVICETMYGARWNTMRRKRLVKEWFTPQEIKRMSDIKSQSYRWYCVKGVPKEGVMMSKNTYDLWHKVAEFCMML